MTYLQTSRRPQRARARIIMIIALVAVVAAAAISFFAPHLFPAMITSIARPFWSTEFAIQSGSLKSSGALLAENESLLRTIAEMQVRMDTITAVEAENAEFRRLLGRGSDVAALSSSTVVTALTGSRAMLDHRILAAVLRRPPLAHYDEIIIDIGSDHALSTSSLAYAVGNVPIGRVIDVLGSTAKVKLFSSPGERYDVLIGAESVPATAIGRGAGQYEAQVSRDTDVKAGDHVIHASFRDRPFGTVVSVLADPAQPFETVLFAPPINIFDLRWVLIENKR